MLAGLAILLCGGCAAVSVHSVGPAAYIANKRGDILTTGRLSETTQQTLAVSGLEDVCADPTPACITAMQDTQLLDDDQRLSALAEVSLKAALAITGTRDVSWSDEQFDLWLRTARLAYAYLFFGTRPAAERAFEERQTQVRDYYNYAIQRTATALFQRMLLTSTATGDDPRLIHSVGSWQLRFDLTRMRLPAGIAVPKALFPATSLKFSGLRSVYRRDGFGAQLVADASAAAPGGMAADVDANVDANEDRRAHQSLEAAVASQHLSRQQRLGAGTWYREMTYPTMTLLFRFPGTSLAELFAQRDVELVVYDPYQTTSVELNGQSVPLGADFSSGYGLWLARSGFLGQSLSSLFLNRFGIGEPHIFLMQPFDPDRRILITLHGLASSPEAWVNVANELQGDPKVRKAFQIWEVYYPTNVPIFVNLAEIRSVVLNTLHHFDPDGQARASRDIVLVGHSMGGVLARLLVSSSGDAIWDAFTTAYLPPGAQVERARDRLDPYLHFTPLPGVERAIFIAAPHRGTPFASNPLSRWASNLVQLPLTLLDDVEDALQDMGGDYGAEWDNHAHRVPNSIDQLRDTDPMIHASESLPISPDVRYHSILARLQKRGPVELTDDGLVPYVSAHLDGAQSEYVIGGWHELQDSPLAILELRRILHEDIRELGERGRGGDKGAVR